MSVSKTTFLLAAVTSAFLASAGRAEDLATDVAGKLRDSGALSGYRVHVKSKSGTVWLEGRVADEQQLAAAVGIAETTPGVERVVNRLVIDGKPVGNAGGFALPTSTWGVAGVPQPEEPVAKKSSFAAMAGGLLFAGGEQGAGKQPPVQLVQATAPAAQQRGAVQRVADAARRSPQQIGRPTGRPINPGRPQDPRYRTAMRTSGMGEPMTLPAPGGYGGHVADGQMVPGTMQYSDGYAPGAAGDAGGVMGGPGMAGGPAPMGGTGVGMPPVPIRGDGPNMPNYAWPSYAAYPNYAAVQYPTQYSPTAWPYIGPFYPYPQVPLGWRRVSLEWDDGWWWLDFDERHVHSHHR